MCHGNTYQHCWYDWGMPEFCRRLLKRLYSTLCSTPSAIICGPKWLWKVPYNGRVSLDLGTRGDIYPELRCVLGFLDMYQEWKYDCLTNFPSACN
jgi:hypothetical protein